MRVVKGPVSGTYRVNVTENFMHIFPGLTRASIEILAESEEEAKQAGEIYFRESKNPDFTFDCDTFILEFTNGKTVKIWNADGGGIISGVRERV